MTVSLADQIKEAGRELGMRKGVYGRWVATGKMTQAEADQRIAAMDAIYATLKGLQNRPLSASVRAGLLTFTRADGSMFNCLCIGEPYASEIAKAFS